jgi:SlyX protein
MYLTPLEVRVAHCLRAIDDLSDVVARQDREIAWLRARVAVLLDREAERERDAARGGAVERPPHW